MSKKCFSALLQKRPDPLPLLILLTTAFIFSRSLPDPGASREESAQVMALLRPLLAFFFGEARVTIHFVRKLAHFVEFGVLGLEVGLLGRTRSGGVLFCLLIALIDETIQIFTGRGPQVQDVWLDFAGAVTGIAAGAAIHYLIKKKPWKR